MVKKYSATETIRNEMIRDKVAEELASKVDQEVYHQLAIQEDILPWLITVPHTDVNFRSRIKDANIETLKEVLKSDLGKCKRAVIEAKIRGLERDEMAVG